MRLLPGWLAFQQDQSFTLDGDESIRRRPVDRIAEPLRLMGARIEAREGRFPPFTVHGAPLRGIEYELPVASAQVKSCVLLAGLVTDATTVIEPVPTRDHTERMLRRGRRPGRRARATPAAAIATTVGNADELELEPVDGPRRPVLGRVPDRRRGARPRLAAGARARRRQLDPRRLPADPRADGRDRAGRRSSRRARSTRVEPVADLDVRNAPIEATDGRGRRGAAGDRRAAAGGAARLLRRGRDRRPRAPAELRVKESDRIATVVEGLRGLGARDRGAARRLRRAAAPGGCAAGGSTPTATTGWRCSARSPAWPRRRGSRWSGWRRPRCPTRGFADDVAALVGVTVVAIDGPAGAGKSTRRPGGRRRARVHLPRHRARCTARVALAAAERGAEPASDRGDAADRARRADPARRARRDRRDPRARGVRGGLAGRRRPRRPRGDGRAEQRRLLASGDWVAEGRDIGTVVAPDAEVKVFLTADPEERARRRAAELGRRPGHACWPSRAIRDERDRTREHSPLAPAAGAVVLDTTRLTLRRGRAADRGARARHRPLRSAKRAHDARGVRGITASGGAREAPPPIQPTPWQGLNRGSSDEQTFASWGHRDRAWSPQSSAVAPPPHRPSRFSCRR